VNCSCCLCGFWTETLKKNGDKKWGVDWSNLAVRVESVWAWGKAKVLARMVWVLRDVQVWARILWLPSLLLPFLLCCGVWCYG